jgi:hypothetical protein
MFRTAFNLNLLRVEQVRSPAIQGDKNSRGDQISSVSLEGRA